MGGDFNVLRDVIRKPMLSWWLRCGVWWVGAAASLQIFNLIMHRYFNFFVANSSTGQDPWYFKVSSSVGYLAGLLFAVAWLLAAIHCRKLVTGFLEGSQTPCQAGYTPLLFRLAYSQGLFLVLLVWLMFLSSQIYDQLLYASVMQNQSHWLVGIDMFSTAVRAVLPMAISMIWLTGLLAILPRRTWPAWGLLVAEFGLGLIMLAVQPFLHLEDFAFNNTQFVPPSWGWWLGPVAFIGLFLCLRTNWFKLAWVLYGLVAVCVFAWGFPIYLFGNLNHSQLQLVYLSNCIGLAFNHVPQFGIYEWVSAMEQQRLSQGTALVHLIPVLPIIVSLLWPVAMYALMYYVLLRPWRKATVSPE